MRLATAFTIYKIVFSISLCLLFSLSSFSYQYLYIPSILSLHIYLCIFCLSSSTFTPFFLPLCFFSLSLSLSLSLSIPLFFLSFLLGLFSLAHCKHQLLPQFLHSPYLCPSLFLYTFISLCRSVSFLTTAPVILLFA